MHTGSRLLHALLPAAFALTIVGCGPADPSAAEPTADQPPVGLNPSGRAPAGPDTDQEARMQIRITIADQQFRATLADSAAGRDLVSQLPLTIDMVDHGSVEKTGRLPSPLSLDGQPDGADPDVGDVGYYAPGRDLVLYYGDQSYYDGIVILGRLLDDAAEEIAGLDGSVTATVEYVVD